MCILVGPAGCGKTSSVKSLCALLGRKLTVLPVTSEMDTIELLGGFEQVLEQIIVLIKTEFSIQKIVGAFIIQYTRDFIY